MMQAFLFRGVFNVENRVIKLHNVISLFSISSKGGQHGTLAESVPYCPPQAKMSHIALPGGQYGTFRPILPSLEGNMGRPSHIALPGGQYGTDLPH